MIGWARNRGARPEPNVDFVKRHTLHFVACNAMFCICISSVCIIHDGLRLCYTLPHWFSGLFKNAWMLGFTTCIFLWIHAKIQLMHLDIRLLWLILRYHFQAPAPELNKLNKLPERTWHFKNIVISKLHHLHFVSLEMFMQHSWQCESYLRQEKVCNKGILCY